ncbi:hypothetical protein RRG08_041841 [Elysia crispata]|uniref:Uncharacterized protein n=1 Tax=Elysia crispata TaxID=231223 RepID=A0AAE1CQC4_9GAST|nr:hypothetical protein RRG08_041841 [Elysia crispata]
MIKLIPNPVTAFVWLNIRNPPRALSQALMILEPPQKFRDAESQDIPHRTSTFSLSYLSNHARPCCAVNINKISREGKGFYEIQHHEQKEMSGGEKN